PFKKSRGIVVLDSLKYPDLEKFYDEYPLNGVNSFTLISVGNDQMTTFSRDGQKRHKREVSSEMPHIWASPRLYTDHWQKRRKFWLRNFLSSHPGPTPEEVLQFH